MITYEIIASQILFAAEQKEAEPVEVAAITEETTIPEGNNSSHLT